jgi:hypothetical protein
LTLPLLLPLLLLQLPIGNKVLPLPDPKDLPTYPPFSYLKCTDASLHRNWTAWSYCADLTTVPQEMLSQYFSLGAFMHAATHWIVGSISEAGVQGDMTDVATSPNEVLMFFAHHANLDRNNMMWQVRGASVRGAGVYRVGGGHSGGGGVLWGGGLGGAFGEGGGS